MGVDKSREHHIPTKIQFIRDATLQLLHITDYNLSEMQVTDFACSCSDATGSFEKLNTGRKIILLVTLWWKGAAGPSTTNLNGVVGADAEHAAAADGHGGGERAGGVGGVDGGVGQYHVGEAAPRRPCEGRRRTELSELSFPSEKMAQG
jgi:hypothetical protein